MFLNIIHVSMTRISCLSNTNIEYEYLTIFMFSIPFRSIYHARISVPRKARLNIDMFKNGIYPNNRPCVEYFLALTSPPNVHI